MKTPSRVAAHLIVGEREEPFLSALLDSLEGVADSLIVNDNSGRPNANRRALEASAFARAGTLHVDETPFLDFSTARNRCLELHVKLDAGDWIAFVDADEVHFPAARAIARSLPDLSSDIAFVDGYTWHFFATPDWYTSIERRMAFYRYSPALRWTGTVHEQLTGASGRRHALPYVYAHFGHILPPRRHAEKGRLYCRLGRDGPILREDQLDRIDVREYWREYWPRLLRFHGEYPPAARAIIAELRHRHAPEYAEYDAIARAGQTAWVRVKNTLRRANFEQRWRLRALKH